MIDEDMSEASHKKQNKKVEKKKKILFAVDNMNIG